MPNQTQPSGTVHRRPVQQPTPKRAGVAGTLVTAVGIALGGVSFSPLAQAEVGGTADPAATRDIMRDAYEALAYLLPASAASFADGETRQGDMVDASLEKLRRAGASLAAHAGGEDTEYQLLARSFDLTVDDVALALESGVPSYAWFLMLDLTQYCSACHQKLPGDTGPMFSQKLLARVDTSMFERDEMARLYVALRQFDRAQSTFEQMMLRPDVHPVDADLDGILIEYLTLTLTVEADARRADGFLRRYADRRDTPFYLKERIAKWRSAMDELEPMMAREAALADAIRLFERAGNAKQVPFDRAGAVEDILAARKLRELLLTDAIDDAEARQSIYYMLGLIHLRTLEPRPAVPEMELLLEAAIRSAPWTKEARTAYGLLEEYGYVEADMLAYVAHMEGSAAPRAPLIDMAELRTLTGIAEPVDSE